MMQGRARHLFNPISIRTLGLQNRFVMSPMTRHGAPQRIPGPEVAAYYEARARGGTGLIITEGVAIDHPSAVDYPAVPALHGEAALAGWRAVIEAVHGAGGKIIPQLWHQGPLRDPRISDRPDLVGVRPSGLWGPAQGTVSLDRDLVDFILAPTRAATDEEIQEVVDAYARSARNAVSVGFDGIAIHAGHGYLIDSFLWSETNKREDRWRREGAAFAVAVVGAIRDAIGPDFPIFYRFSQFKMQDYLARLVNTPQELESLLCPIAEAGVDVFDGSQRFYDLPAFEGSRLNLAGWAKKLTGRASMTVGGIGLSRPFGDTKADRPLQAVDNLDRLIERFEEGEFDLAAVGRSLINDAAWVGRVRDGREFLPFDPTRFDTLI